ncbi:MAG: hypothetical protein WA183_04655 [Chthoniobacterales bacterium]
MIRIPIRDLVLVGIALTLPFRLNVVAAANDLYEADTNSGNVFKFAPNASRSTFASGLTNPEGLAFDVNFNLFVSDTGTNSIFKFTPSGTRTAFATGLNGPASLVFDAAGNLFDAEFFGGTILKFTPGGVRSTFATGLSGPGSLLLDPAGNLIEADFNTGQIFKFTPNGTKTTFATGIGHPHGLAFDRLGNLFVASFDGSILKFTPGGTRTTFATGLSGPHGLTFDGTGNLFEADFSSGTIFKFTPNGTKTTFASGLSNPAGLLFEPATGWPLNISTRARVQTGNDVMIAGFIVIGTGHKRVIVRAIGPSLAQHGITNPLQNPTLELHDHTGAVIAFNDNWMNAPNRQEIINSGLAPSNNLESAILRSLNPGNYTAIVRGVNNGTGIALVEGYDLDPAAGSKLGNISTRALVQTGDNVMIGGFITGGGNGNAVVLVRAIGPSLAQHGITNPLQDPTLELHNGNGALIAFNDNWRDTQETEIQATGLSPTNDLESAILISLPNGATTAILRGKNFGTGVGLIEVFRLN